MIASTDAAGRRASSSIYRFGVGSRFCYAIAATPIIEPAGAGHIKADCHRSFARDCVVQPLPEFLRSALLSAKSQAIRKATAAHLGVPRGVCVFGLSRA